MAAEGFQKVLDSFEGDPTFMGTSDRAQRRERTIAEAHPDVQGLRGLLPDHIIERLARLDEED